MPNRQQNYTNEEYKKELLRLHNLYQLDTFLSNLKEPNHELKQALMTLKQLPA